MAAHARSVLAARPGSTRSHDDGRVGVLDGARAVTYECPSGDRFILPLHPEAAAPSKWPCTRCGVAAAVVDPGGAAVGLPPAGPRTPPVKTHYERVLERRSVEELQALLDERLTVLRTRRSGK